ncbi:MAG: XRE family transcriptional regulator [Planctomycetota bacterium]
MQVGRFIKTRRKAVGMTLAQLAESSSVSAAMLSEIERDRKNPTIRTLNLIARGLGCQITDLLDTEDRPKIEVIRADDHTTLIDPNNGMRFRTLSNALKARGVFLVSYVLPPHTETLPVPPEQTEMVKVGICTRGRLLVTIGEESYEQYPGDTISFSADVPHGAANRWDEEAEFIVVAHRADAPGSPGHGMNGRE